MRLLIKDRGQGKTTQLIYTSEATGYPIVVETPMQKSALMNKAKDMNVIIPEPMTIHDIKQNMKLRSNHIEKVIIDEGYNIIEKALNEYIGCNVMAVTFTDRIKEKTQLQNTIQELLAENEKLKQDINNLTRHNARGAGRKPKPQEKIQEQLQQLDKLLNDNKTEQDICKNMGISRATYYRLKKLAKDKSKI